VFDFPFYYVMLYLQEKLSFSQKTKPLHTYYSISFCRWLPSTFKSISLDLLSMAVNVVRLPKIRTRKMVQQRLCKLGMFPSQLHVGLSHVDQVPMMFGASAASFFWSS
jgi:hypothetical protein